MTFYLHISFIFRTFAADLTRKWLEKCVTLHKKSLEKRAITREKSLEKRVDIYNLYYV